MYCYLPSLSWVYRLFIRFGLTLQPRRSLRRAQALRLAIFHHRQDTGRKSVLCCCFGRLPNSREIITLESHAYIFQVDLFEDEDVSRQSSSSLLSSIDKLPEEIRGTPLVSVISSALRRFAMTGDVHSSAGAIEPALDALAVQNDGRLTILRYITWAIPSIGFIGTVRGIGQAMAQAELAVDGNIGPMTSSLGVAFNSTFVALLISVVIMFAVSILQRRQDEQLVSIQQYVEEYIIKRVVMA